MTTTTASSSKRRSPARSKKQEDAVSAPPEASAPVAAEPAPKPARKRAAAAKPAVPEAAPAAAPKKPAARKKAQQPAEVAPEPVAAAVPAKRGRKKAVELDAAEEAVVPALNEPVAEAAPEPAKKKAAPKKKARPAAEPAPPAEPPRYSLGSREEEEGVFGDYELLDRELGASFRLRLLGPLAWRCSCAKHREQADCEHGEALLTLLPLAQIAELDAGWPAGEAEVWLVEQGGERRLQWVAGLAVPAALNELAKPALDELLRLPAERSHGWLQALLDAARTAGVPLRIAPEVWTQLAAARDAQARVQRLEPLLQEPGALAALLKEPLPAYQWEAALFAVCAGRALIADDLGLGQRGAALAAIALWARLFGVEPALVIAPAAAQEAWRRDIQRLLGDWPAALTLAEQAPTSQRAARPQLLVVDALDGLDEAALAALRALEAPQLLLITEREPLGDARLVTWVDWLDVQRRGPLARLAALPADASKKAQREALQTVLLSRRKRELQQEQQLPAALLQPRWLHPDGPAQPPAALQQLRALVERWQRLRFLGAAEQQQLLQALALLPPSSRHVLTAKVEALLALRQEWLREGGGGAAARLLVCAQSETLLDSLAQALKVRKVAALRLRASADQGEVLSAWRVQGQGLLLASDAALAAHAGSLDEPRLALVHADLPWSAALPAQRLRRACGEAASGVPVAQLLVEGSPDRALLSVQQAGVEFPAWLDAPPAWLDEAQLAALMPALQALLAAL